MINPHPPLSSFPAVICTLAVILELIALKYRFAGLPHTRLFLTICLILFMPITYISGQYGLDYVIKIDKSLNDVVYNHQLIAKMSLISLVPLGLFSILRYFQADKLFVRLLHYCCLLLTFVLIGVTSFRGGELVFTHGIAVKTSTTASNLED